MSGWVKKRFWADVSVEGADGGFGILLDMRPLRSPAKAPLVVPTLALAEMIAAEWRSMDKIIDPTKMPATRAANAAIDKVADQQAEVAELITAYGDSDLVCYRAEHPDELIAREARAWDPLLDWAAHRYGHRSVTRIGVMHRPQPPLLLDAMRTDVLRLGAFELTAFHDLVALPGSLIMALAHIDGFAGAESLWYASRVDEDWQAEQWGVDDEAVALAEGRKAAFLQAAAFWAALKA
jgi:chaperone required for assembly of F1-ATPase